MSGHGPLASDMVSDDGKRRRIPRYIGSGIFTNVAMPRSSWCNSNKEKAL